MHATRGPLARADTAARGADGRAGGFAWSRATHTTETEAEYARASPRILILGAGFAGLAAATALDGPLRRFPRASVLVVDQNTDTLMSPLLWSVAAGRARAEDVMVPIRAFQRGRRFHVLKAAVEGVDLDRRVVVTEAGPRPYDYLIVALGSVTTLPRLPGLREYARPFRTVGHAIDLRNRLVDALEQGHHAESADERRSWLTFVVGGGGDTGVELAATIQEFLDHGLLKQYPWLAERNGGGPPFRVVVVGRGERLLPLAPPATSAAIASRLAELGVEVRTGTAVTAVEPRRIVTDRGDVPACTLFWAAGIEPSPVLRDVPVEKQKGGALVVDERLALPSHPEVYVVGDAAWANDGVTGQPCPPTAQAANQQGAYAGRALAARLGGRQPARFRWRSKGHLVLLGHHGAVAEIGRLRIAGWPAWAAWHGFYLSRVPSWRHRVRLVNDWWLAAALGRDSSQIRL